LLYAIFYRFVDYAIWRICVNQDGLKLNDTHQLLVYAKDINILGGNVHGVKKKADALEVVTKGIGLEVNDDKPKYTVMS
jgi:hypothetical protein